MVEFEVWDTPFKDGEISVIDVVYRDGGFADEFHEAGKRYCGPAHRDLGDADLVVRVFRKETESVYALLFRHVGAFRVLDERGLLGLWDGPNEPRRRPNASTFRVRNHAWTAESPLTFELNAEEGWSYMVATSFDCVEVVCSEPPEIRLEETIKPEPIAKNEEVEDR